MATISIVISEPLPTNGDGIGAFEWRTDYLEAEAEFQQLKSPGSTTRLWASVTVPDALTPEQITDYVGGIYWDLSLDQQVAALGLPTLEAGAASEH